MGWKSAVVCVATTATLTVCGLGAVTPRTADEIRLQREQQLVRDGADARRLEEQRRRATAVDGIDADGRDRLRPGEHRPPEPRVPRLRGRL